MRPTLSSRRDLPQRHNAVAGPPPRGASSPERVQRDDWQRFRTNINLDATGTGTAGKGHIVEDLRIESARFIEVVVEGFRFYHREQFRVRHRER